MAFDTSSTKSLLLINESEENESATHRVAAVEVVVVVVAHTLPPRVGERLCITHEQLYSQL